MGEGWEGTELVIGQEGGYAAAIVALMARGRISFSTEVPDQLVVLDPNLAAVDDQYVRVLQRYKDLLRESGAMDERDIAVMHSAAASGPSKLPTSNDLFKKRAEKSANDRKRTSASDPSSSAATTSANGGPVKRLRLADDDGEAADEIVFQDATQSAPGSGDAPEGGVGGDSGGRAVTQVAKSASRIALYMMRENEPGARASEKLGKFVVVIKSCTVISHHIKIKHGSKSNFFSRREGRPWKGPSSAFPRLLRHFVVQSERQIQGETGHHSVRR